ncbi:regulatory protein RecX [Salinispira pacifica]|uniref:Regulatory protein RecX n=1 Tax=Salinispira pacifica TaxID=1307761 RepID=V5WCS7_9SPIO|nr:regulatory protein RecX [Salinispira pacifica]AHC13603.1 hypothetical protein L21SP2_0159 [Salinispira pacifica]
MTDNSADSGANAPGTAGPYHSPPSPISSLPPDAPDVLHWSFQEDRRTLSFRIQETPDVQDGSPFDTVLPRELTIREPFVHDLLIEIEMEGKPGISTVLEAEALQNCYLQGLTYVSRREHSRQQLSIKLRRKGYSAEQIRRALDELENEDSLSDRRFAEQWTRNRLQRHPEGRINIIAGLQQRGVHRSTCNEVLGELETDDPGLFTYACLNFLLKMHRKNADSEELIFSCRKRGFSIKNLENCSKEFYSITGMKIY